MNPIIRIDNLGKRYCVGAPRAAYATLRETLAGAARAPLRLLRRNERAAHDNIWALKDVSFEVRPGEVVGVIGRNGAGKSTLLKVLSRITTPTTGRVDLYGRVGSLLEVGAGFHPELTGRENIFLSGIVLGMRRREIQRKFDEIVAFSQIERFIDTPVKRYSNGMYLRLAFAVAVHLETEVVAVDEVLAVGDAAFQKKCLGKMDRVAHQGRTVLFVSHQMTAIKSLCTRAIQLESGRVVQDGDPRTVVDRYLKEGSSGLTPQRDWPDPQERPGTAEFRLVGMRVVSEAGELLGTYPSSRPIVVEMDFDVARLHSALCVGFDLMNRHGTLVFRTCHNDRHEREWPVLKVGRNRLQCVIPPGLLNFGPHFVAPKIMLHEVGWLLDGEAALSFEVQMDHSESPLWNSENHHKFPGAISPSLIWRNVDGIRSPERDGGQRR